MNIFSKIFKSKQREEKKDVENSSSYEIDLRKDFDDVCKETIFPFFRELGFQRKNLHFIKQTNDIIQCFNVQKSKWNSYDKEMTFTFNFGFFSSEIHQSLNDNDVQNKFPKTYDCFIQNRLGTFSHKHDHWYKLLKKGNKKNIIAEVKKDLETFMKPIFLEFNSLDVLQKFLESDSTYRSSISLIQFYMLVNQIEKGRELIIDNYQKAIIPQEVSDIINFPDGTQQIKTRTVINKAYIENLEKIAVKYGIKL